MIIFKMLNIVKKNKKNLVLTSLILTLSIITIQIIITFLDINTWPLSSYGMFSHNPPNYQYGYSIEYVTSDYNKYREVDYSKVSYEIYKDFRRSGDIRVLSQYLAQQAKRYGKKKLKKVLKATIYEKSSINPEKAITIYTAKQ